MSKRPRQAEEKMGGIGGSSTAFEGCFRMRFPVFFSILRVCPTILLIFSRSCLLFAMAEGIGS